MKVTLFKLVEELGQAEVARRLSAHGEPVYRSYISRVVNLETGILAGFIARCAATPGLCDEGKVFDAEGTLLEWYRRLRVGSSKASNSRAHAQAEEGGHAA